jgi:hypothetical protein
MVELGLKVVAAEAEVVVAVAVDVAVLVAVAPKRFWSRILVLATSYFCTTGVHSAGGPSAVKTFMPSADGLTVLIFSNPAKIWNTGC